jgi:hypothetical protein
MVGIIQIEIGIGIEIVSLSFPRSAWELFWTLRRPERDRGSGQESSHPGRGSYNYYVIRCSRNPQFMDIDPDPDID